MKNGFLNLAANIMPFNARAANKHHRRIGNRMSFSFRSKFVDELHISQLSICVFQ